MSGGAFQLAVIGDPIGHSLSPPLWTELLGLADRHGQMEAVQVTPAELPAFLDDVRSGRFHGLSVTLPHKERALALADDVEEGAARVGAANCIVQRGGRLTAANTDVDGVRAALTRPEALPHGPPRAALVLGAGGAARAGVIALLDLGVQDVAIANRTLERAADLVASVGDERVRSVPLTSDALNTALRTAALLINATSVGLQAADDDPLPADVALSARHTVMDMVYRPRATALLRRAAAASAIVVDGLWMLAGQALAAFARFAEQPPPDVLAPLHAHLVSMMQAPASAGDDLAFLAARAAIDRADTAIVEALGQRFAAAHVIGRIKERLGEPVVRPEREAQLRARLIALGHDVRLPDGLVTAVYDPVLIASRGAQESLRAAPMPTAAPSDEDPT